MMIQKQFRVPCRSKAQATLPQILALPEENMLQSNRKTVHRVYLEWRAAGSGPLTPAQWAAISPIAHQCASEGGTAVYLARALYQMQENKAFNDESLCSAVEERTTTAKPPIADKSRLWPNPGNGQINLWVAGVAAKETAIVQITDISGKIMQTVDVHLSDENAAIDASQLSPGLYFCTVKAAGIVKATMRFAVTR